MDRMYQLIDIEHGDEIGIITEDQVQFLIDNLEEGRGRRSGLLHRSRRPQFSDRKWL